MQMLDFFLNFISLDKFRGGSKSRIRIEVGEVEPRMRKNGGAASAQNMASGYEEGCPLQAPHLGKGLHGEGYRPNAHSRFFFNFWIAKCLFRCFCTVYTDPGYASTVWACLAFYSHEF